MKIDFHVHTHHSYDSLMKPTKIINLARQRGLDGIIITDHNTIAGGLEALEANPYEDFHVIVGAEIKTDAGDITGIHLKNEIKSRRFSEVCREIKNQGGKTILNHPFVDHDLSKVDFSLIDMVEGYNARTNTSLNQKAIDLAKKYDKPISAGSDAHLYSEIANAYTIVDSIETLVPIDHKIRYNKIYHQTWSQYIKAYKSKSLKTAFAATVHFAKRFFREDES